MKAQKHNRYRSLKSPFPPIRVSRGVHFFISFSSIFLLIGVSLLFSLYTYWFNDRDFAAFWHVIEKSHELIPYGGRGDRQVQLREEIAESSVRR
jgi:hypothetical protein